MFHIEASDPQKQILKDYSWWLRICLIGMFTLAMLVRLDDIKAPGHLLDREYTSAIFARAYYFMNNEEVETWRQDIAVATKNQQPLLEPPLLEYLVSLIYRVMGKEDISFSRYLTSGFWVVGGIFMFLMVRKLLSTDEAVVATAYYLFVPMGVIISRSFQPDSLMMMMFLISLYALIIYFEVPGTERLLLASIMTGITLLLRPLVIFAIFGAFLALSTYHNKNWKKIIDRPLITFSIISILPFLIYYGYGIILAGFMRWKISSSFMPYLLLKKDFWVGWVDVAVDVAEITPVLLAIFGFFLLPKAKVQHLMIGLSVSFILFTFAFTYHIHTHPYYHIQLFLIVGICMAVAILAVVKNVMQLLGGIASLPIMVALLLSFYVGYREVRTSLYQTHMEDPGVAREIGELIQHSPHTVYVAQYYGLPLEYYGEFGGAPWPVKIEDAFYRKPGERELSVEERIKTLGFQPEYFVITNFDLYRRLHQDLKAFLESDCSLQFQSPGYLIYGDCFSVTSH